MRVKYLLDTHAWVWWTAHPENLSRKVQRLLEDADQYEELLLSAISVWEFCKLLEKGRLAISHDPRQWIDRALETPKLRLVPLSPSVAYHATTLPEAPTRDPGDQIIIATARLENATIMSKDEVIRNYKYVRSLW